MWSHDVRVSKHTKTKTKWTTDADTMYQKEEVEHSTAAKYRFEGQERFCAEGKNLNPFTASDCSSVRWNFKRRCRARSKNDMRKFLSGKQIEKSSSKKELIEEFMTLVYCGSLASVRSHKPASLSRVSASCSASLHMLFFFLAQVFKHRLASVVANSLDRLWTDGSDHVILDRSSWKLPHRTIGGIRSPARTRTFLLRPCGPNTQKHSRT